MHFKILHIGPHRLIPNKTKIKTALQIKIVNYKNKKNNM